VQREGQSPTKRGKISSPGRKNPDLAQLWYFGKNLFKQHHFA